jgi:hypothetical protein
VNTDPTGRQLHREARLQFVPLGLMKINPLAQRELNKAWVDKIAAAFELEEMGNPVVNRRDSLFFIIDGQHRIEALKLWLGVDWEDQHIECQVYEGLTEQQEAERFLRLQSRLRPSTFDSFRVAVSAGRADEMHIGKITDSLGLSIARGKRGISATGTLKRIYAQGGPDVLERTLRVIRDAYGEAGFEAFIIDGIGLFCRRYPKVAEDRVVKQLSTAAGGAGALLNRANQLRQQLGYPKAQCVAAAVVETVNRGPGGGKIASWWRTAEPDTLL